MSPSRPPMQLFVDRLLDRSMLGAAETEALLSLGGREVQVRAQLDIVPPGEEATSAWLVVDGLLGRFGQVIDGRRQITALHIAGDMCNLHALVTPRMSGALQALSAATVIRVDYRDLRHLVRTFPLIAEAFWRDCAAQASILSQWLVNIGRRDAQSRLAHLLCELAVRFEQARLGNRRAFRLDASQVHIGDALGLTAVHVNRVFRVIRDKGLVGAESRTILIHDWAGLAALGDFDEAYLHMKSHIVADALTSA